MLGPLRKFSSSIYAKIFLILVAIPFVFWGMGPVFQGGKLNTIVEIGNDSLATEDFINFIKYNNKSSKILSKNEIDKLLSTYIADKLISQEIDSFEIELTDSSLGKIIKNNKTFIKDSEFSRTAYEKFLVENSLSAVAFEGNLTGQIKREQLFDLIGGGIAPPFFLVNSVYDIKNQKRFIDVINLNDAFEKKIKVDKKEIQSYFEQNKNVYKNVYKTVKFIELSPKNLIESDEYSELFFKKLDEIDNLIVEGNNLNFILNKYNLKSPNIITLSQKDINKKTEIKIDLQKKIISKIFDPNYSDNTFLLEHDDKFIVFGVSKTEDIQKGINDRYVNDDILLELVKSEKRKIMSNIINKINSGAYKKSDFVKLSKDENTIIQKIEIKNINDNKIFEQEFVNQVYKYPEKKVILIADFSLTKNYLVFIDKIENASIDKNSVDYANYVDLSKATLMNDIYNTYDVYLRNKYKIKINQNALGKVENYFR